MNKLIAQLKENKKIVIRRTIIAGAIVTTVIVVGALYKNGAFSDDSLLLETLEDGSVLLTSTETP